MADSLQTFFFMQIDFIEIFQFASNLHTNEDLRKKWKTRFDFREIKTRIKKLKRKKQGSGRRLNKWVVSIFIPRQRPSSVAADG